MRKLKWLIYTVIIGLIPFVMRFAIWWLSENGKTLDFAINEVDIVMFGLVLNLSIITELENEKTVDPKWKTKCNGFSVIMLIFFSFFLGLSYFEEATSLSLVGINKLKILCAILSAVSFYFCYGVYTRLSDMEGGQSS